MEFSACRTSRPTLFAKSRRAPVSVLEVSRPRMRLAARRIPEGSSGQTPDFTLADRASPFLRIAHARRNAAGIRPLARRVEIASPPFQLIVAFPLVLMSLV